MDIDRLWSLYEVGYNYRRRFLLYHLDHSISGNPFRKIIRNGLSSNSGPLSWKDVCKRLSFLDLNELRK